jgi:ribonuclease III
VRQASQFAQRLGLRIRDLDLLEQALVHRSYLHEHRETTRGHNERLEFLGDAVVNLTVSEALYARYPDDDEGVLSTRRAAIVSMAGLSLLASRIGLGDQLLLGEGEDQRGGRSRPSLLASSFEALVGAIYLDLGWDVTRSWLLELAAPEIELDTPVGSLKSPKSRLQEYTQRTLGGRPEYRVLTATGPDHDKVFRIEVVVDGEVLGRGEGPSRRIAETAAAAEAIESLRKRRRSTRTTAPKPPDDGGVPG